jgi:hypothetical protein
MSADKSTNPALKSNLRFGGVLNPLGTNKKTGISPYGETRYFLRETFLYRACLPARRKGRYRANSGQIYPLRKDEDEYYIRERERERERERVRENAENPYAG